MRLYTQSFLYDDSWPIVSLAFLLRYPNPHARHVVSCDVVSRSITPQGTLSTIRLILKRGALPRWAPKGIVNRAESWVIEESEVDPFGRLLRCRTKNLDHVKVMQVQEFVELREADNGGTLQTTQAQFISRFGWGLTKRIENHGLAKFKSNIQKSREGVALVLQVLRDSRLRTLAVGPDGRFSHIRSATGTTFEPRPWTYEEPEIKEIKKDEQINEYPRSNISGAWSALKAWISARR